jgi:hypothetical protein
METLKLGYKEMVEEIEKLDLASYAEKRMLQSIEKIFQNRSKELGVPSGAPVVHPLWFTPLVQGVVSHLWECEDEKERHIMRSAAVRYLKEEAEKAGEKIFMHDAIDLIKSVL